MPKPAEIWMDFALDDLDGGEVLFTGGKFNMTAGKSPPFTEGMKGACPQRGHAKDANYCGETLANR